MRRTWMRVLAAVFVLTLTAAACGGDEDGGGGTGDGGGSPTAEDGGGGGADLTIVDFSFSPADLTVSDGDTITVLNIGDSSHTFTTEDQAIDEEIGPGEEVEVTIEGVASQGFSCRFHSQMTGNLTVE